MPYDTLRGWRTLTTTAAILAGALAPIVPLAAQRPQAPGPDTSGFVITDPVVIRRCGGCHTRDSTGRMGRLSFMRKAPEGWEASMRRMVTLNNVRVTPEEARAIVRVLSNTQGLAPEEARPARWESERRSDDQRYLADAVTERTCRACHSVGRLMLQRRTKAEWELLVATHRGYYPGSDFQGFRRQPPPDSAGAPHPMDQAIAHLARAYPLKTTAWNAWSATMRPPPLDGNWLLSGKETGRGSFFGRMTIQKEPGTEDEFTTRATYRYADGRTVQRTGKTMVYTGYQWRGRSTPSRGSADSAWREVMMVEPGWQQIAGRWFRGGYDEFGLDVSLARLTTAPVVLGVSARGLRAGGADQEVTIFGANLARAAANAIDFGPGVTVNRVVRSTDEEITVRVNVAAQATPGVRDLFVAGASQRGAVVVYDKLDRIRVTPQAAMARVGGIRFPKQFAQFEAMGLLNGPDTKPDTEDDIEVGVVPVSWSIEEYGVTYQDDDIKWVGDLDQRGFFTPAIDGPNPKRKGNRNNIGDVWVVATYQAGGAAARPLKARAHLVVTVPLYMRWEPTRTAP